MIEVTAIVGEALDQKLIGTFGLYGEPEAIEAEKNISRKECDSFVAIDKGMVVYQRFEHCCGHFE